MKAWLVREKHNFCSTVVFAETRGKARAMALATDICEDAKFCDIEANRLPQIDKYYAEGKTEMDWFNPKDRVVLVRDCGFVCDIDYWEPEDCETCSAKQYCDKYEEFVGDDK